MKKYFVSTVVILSFLISSCQKNQIDNVSITNDFYIFMNNKALYQDTSIYVVSNAVQMSCSLGSKGELNSEKIALYFPATTTRFTGEQIMGLKGKTFPMKSIDTSYSIISAEIVFNLNGKNYTTRSASSRNNPSKLNFKITDVDLAKTVSISPTKKVRYYNVKGSCNANAFNVDDFNESINLFSTSFKIQLAEKIL
jgi:hypothetical protein